MSTLAFYAQFTASKVGVNSLTVTWDIYRVTRSNGAVSKIVAGGATSIAFADRGLYGYLLTGADTLLYDYVATAITPTTTVDQQEIAALWTMYEADALKLAGQTVTAAAPVTFPASVGTSTYAGGAVASVTGNIGGLSAAALQDVGAALASYGAALETTLQAAKAIITEVQALLEASASAAAPMVLPEDRRNAIHPIDRIAG